MLSDFKEYLDSGTNEGLRYKDESISRYISFKKCIDYLSTLKAPKILELGTSRSFVNGCFEGCNSDNVKYWEKDNPSKWDWGAGCFTVIFALELKQANITTIDLIKNHINRCKHMTDSLELNNVNHVVSDSLAFLKKTKEKYDLIYVDTGDMWPIQPTCELQLQECKLIFGKKLLNANGLILIDDVLNGTPREMGHKENKYGKSERSLPYLKDNGYDVIFEGYQYILKEK